MREIEEGARARGELLRRDVDGVDRQRPRAERTEHLDERSSVERAPRHVIEALRDAEPRDGRGDHGLAVVEREVGAWRRGEWASVDRVAPRALASGGGLTERDARRDRRIAERHEGHAGEERGRGDRHELHRSEPAGDERRIVEVADADRGIDGVLDEVHLAVGQADVGDLRMRLGEGGEGGDDGIGPQEAGHGDGEASARDDAALGNRRAGRVELVNHAPAVLDEDGAVVRQRDAAGGAMEQADAELGLEPCDGLANARKA